MRKLGILFVLSRSSGLNDRARVRLEQVDHRPEIGRQDTIIWYRMIGLPTAEIHAMNPTSCRELVTVATYWDPMEAQIARLRLAHEGMPAFLEKECTVQMVWHITNAIGGVRLVVPLSRHDEARKLLEHKELFNDWRPTRCWELSVNGNRIVPEEEGLAAARDLEFKEPLAPREEIA